MLNLNKTKKRIKPKLNSKIENEDDIENDLEEIVLKLNSIISRSNKIDEKLTDLEVIHGKRNSLDIIRTSPITKLELNNKTKVTPTTKKVKKTPKKSIPFSGNTSSISNYSKGIPSPKPKSTNSPKKSKRNTQNSINPEKESNLSSLGSDVILLQILNALNSLKSEVAEISQAQKEMKNEIALLQQKT